MRVFNGFKVLKKVYLKYKDELRKYVEEVRKVNDNVKVDFKKTEIKRGRIREVFFTKPKILLPRQVNTALKAKLKSSIPPPPKFPLEGLRCEIVGSDIVLDYKIFRRVKNVFEGLKVEPLYVDVYRVIDVLCKFSRELSGRTIEKAGVEPKWTPLISSGILSEVSKELGVSEEDIKDAILYAYDVGIILIERGESGEIWLNIEVSCRGSEASMTS